MLLDQHELHRYYTLEQNRQGTNLVIIRRITLELVTVYFQCMYKCYIRHIIYNVRTDTFFKRIRVWCSKSLKCQQQQQNKTNKKTTCNYIGIFLFVFNFLQDSKI